MHTELHVSGHVDSKGTVTCDEPVPLPAGPVEMTIRQSKSASNQTEEDISDDEAVARRRMQLKEIRALLAAHGPIGEPKPMSDIDEIIYGPKAPLKRRGQ